jgi:tetratricopeptide (TPR) repeat protein
MERFGMAIDPDKDAFGGTIFDFAMNGGRFAILTDDAGFVELLKTVLHHSLGVSRKSLFHVTRLDDLFSQLQQDGQARYVICMERSVVGPTIERVLADVKRTCSGSGIIVLTREVDQYSTALLVEQGANNIITKPISIASLTEKLAFTIAPQGKLGKLIDKGKKLLGDCVWGEALLVSDEILTMKPGSAAGFMIKGDAYKGLGMPVRAEEMYLAAVRNAELYLAPLKRLAALYEQTGEPDKRLAYLRRLNEISPLNTQRILEIGELEISRGESKIAEKMFEQAMRIAQRDASEFMSNLSSRIADICVNRNAEMAIRYSKRALDLKGDNLTVEDIATVNVLGISLRKQGKWREAIAEYSRVLAVVPDNAGLLYNTALAYSEGKEYSQALHTVQKALENDPELPGSGKNIAYNIGIIFQKAGQDGTPYFKKAYELDPNDKTVWNTFKRSLAAHGDGNPVSGVKTK